MSDLWSDSHHRHLILVLNPVGPRAKLDNSTLVASFPGHVPGNEATTLASKSGFPASNPFRQSWGNKYIVGLPTQYQAYLRIDIIIISTQLLSAYRNYRVHIFFVCVPVTHMQGQSLGILIQMFKWN